MRVEDFIKQLQERYHPESEVVAVIWLGGDVIDRAGDRGLTLSDAEASQIVKAMERNHDACIGINWDVIDFHLDGLKHDEPL